MFHWTTWIMLICSIIAVWKFPTNFQSNVGKIKCYIDPVGLLQVNITFSFSRLLDICQSECWELISHIITHFVNNVQVKHLTYPYFWQHCWQLDESPPNSSLLLPKHHKSIEKSILKFGFETIGKKCTISGLCSLIFVCLYIESCLYQKLKPSLCTL